MGLLERLNDQKVMPLPNYMPESRSRLRENVQLTRKNCTGGRKNPYDPRCTTVPIIMRMTIVATTISAKTE